MDLYNELLTIFTKEDYRVPMTFQTDNLKDEINSLLSRYIDDLAANQVPLNIIERVRKFQNSCELVLSNYLRGIHSNAFLNFEKAIDNLGIIDSKLLRADLGNDLLFRGRVNSNLNDFSDNEMFHIPLNRRELIRTQRFSFPGLPCLYVGASVYACWAELNRPSFEQFQVSALSVGQNAASMKIVDLSHIPQRLKELMQFSWFQPNEYFLYWPLLAICSIKVRNETAPFKPEYIFPQFFLEYILKNKRSKEYVGIKYASIKVSSICQKQLEDDWHTFVCYVFPSHSDSMIREKCVDLDSNFKMIRNRSGKDLQILTNLLQMDEVTLKIEEPIGKQTATDSYKNQLATRKLFTRDGKFYPYSISIFGMIELALIREDFDLNVETRFVVSSISENELEKQLSINV